MPSTVRIGASAKRKSGDMLLPETRGSNRQATKRDASSGDPSARSSPLRSTKTPRRATGAGLISGPKICRQCGASLMQQHRGRPRMYCSSRCRHEANRELTGATLHVLWPRACQQCGVSLEAQHSGRPRMYCSSRCRQEAYRGRGQPAECIPASRGEGQRSHVQLVASTPSIEPAEHHANRCPTQAACQRCGADGLASDRTMVIHAIEEVIQRLLQTAAVVDVVAAHEQLAEARYWAESALSNARAECRGCRLASRTSSKIAGKPGVRPPERASVTRRLSRIVANR
jgi:ribosomal protein L34E